MYGGLFSCFSNRGRAVRWLGSQLGTLRGLTENARIFHTHARIYLPSPILFLSVTWGRKMKSVWLCNLLSTSGTKTCMEVPWTLQHQMDIRCSSSCFLPLRLSLGGLVLEPGLQMWVFRELRRGEGSCLLGWLQTLVYRSKAGCGARRGSNGEELEKKVGWCVSHRCRPHRINRGSCCRDWRWISFVKVESSYSVSGWVGGADPWSMHAVWTWLPVHFRVLYALNIISKQNRSYEHIGVCFPSF